MLKVWKISSAYWSIKLLLLANCWRLFCLLKSELFEAENLENIQPKKFHIQIALIFSDLPLFADWLKSDSGKEQKHICKAKICQISLPPAAFWSLEVLCVAFLKWNHHHFKQSRSLEQLGVAPCWLATSTGAPQNQETKFLCSWLDQEEISVDMKTNELLVWSLSQLDEEFFLLDLLASAVENQAIFFLISSCEGSNIHVNADWNFH